MTSTKLKTSISARSGGVNDTRIKTENKKVFYIAIPEGKKKKKNIDAWVEVMKR